MTAQSVQTLEYRVKAGFLYNFARFVEWPAESLPPDTRIRVGLLAPDSVCDTIESALDGKSVANHRMEIECLREETPADAPHILFVHSSMTRRAQSLMRDYADQPVLIVGESPNFAANNGVIGFVRRGESLRFEINLEAASDAGLHLSSQLASLAEIVKARP